MRIAALPLLVAVLLPVGTARAEFGQEVGSPLSTGAAPYNVAAADFDGNGRPDVAAANGTAGTVSIYLRGLTGGFTPEAPDLTVAGATDVVAADLNADGRPDLAVAGSGVHVYRRKASGNGFELEPGGVLTGPGATAITAADLNGDSRLDLVYGSSTTDSVYYALRKPTNDGFVTPVQRASIGEKGAVGVADFTGDGQPDIAATNNNGGSYDLWVQRDDGTFTHATDSPFNLGGRIIGLAVADFNADGRPDVAAGDYTNDTIDVQLGQSGGAFVAEGSYPSGDGPVGVETGDFNFDGRPDLAIANQAGLRVTVLLRTEGGFVPDPSSPILTGKAATGIATADFDADTRLDMAVANISTPSTMSILLNTTPFPLPPPPPPPVNLDVDGDSSLRPADCDDANPTIFPGAVDTPGDGIDQDCAGGDATYPRLRRTVAYGIKYGVAYSVFTSLSVKPARAGDRVRLRCKGRGCKVGTKVVSVAKNGPRVSLSRHVVGARMRPGASIEVRITRPGTIGKSVKYTVRSNKKPRRRERCLPPGATAPVKCAA